MSLKLRLTFLVSLCLCATILYDVWTTGRRRAHIDLQAQAEQSAERTPASEMGPLPLVPPPIDPCTHLHQIICLPHAGDQDPTGRVFPDSYGELNALHMYEEIVKKHEDDPKVDLDQIDEELASAIYTDKAVKRLRSAFSWVQHNLEKLIDSQPENIFDANEKKILVSRIKKVQLELPPPASTYADEADLLTKVDVVYERTTDGIMRLRVGGAFILAVHSWFNLIFTLGHELGHSIDPCELRMARISMPAYDRLTACLLKSGIVASRKTRAECGENDQLSETFADWVGVHMVAESLKHWSTEFQGPQMMSAVANSVEDLCVQSNDPTEEIDTSFYPKPQTRIDQIFGLNPDIRQILGCSIPTTGQDYCTW